MQLFIHKREAIMDELALPVGRPNKLGIIAAMQLLYHAVLCQTTPNGKNDKKAGQSKPPAYL
jgi:hypothetical protein